MQKGDLYLGQMNTRIAKSEPTEHRIPQEEIHRKIKQYDAIFSMPDYARERALRSSAFIVSETELGNEVRAYVVGVAPKAETNIPQENPDILTAEEQRLRSTIYEMFGTSVAEVEKRKITFDEFVKAEIESMEGICIPVDGTRSRILTKNGAKLSKDVILGHEILHAASDKKSVPATGFQSEDGQKHNLNEAATELLRISVDYKDLSVRSLFKRIMAGEIQTPYRSNVLKLLAILETTSFDPEPVGLKNLAEYYFSEDSTNEIMFEMEVVKKAHQPVRKKVKSWFDKDLS